MQLKQPNTTQPTNQQTNEPTNQPNKQPHGAEFLPRI